MTFLTRARKVPLKPLALPDYYAGVTLAGIKNPLIKDTVTRYLKGFWDAADAGIAPVFAGRVDAYKTYGACVIARVVHELAGVTVEFFDTATEVPQLDRGWYDGVAAKRLNAITAAPLLIVDDFARVRSTGREVSIMDEIGQRRYNAGLPTIWTANVKFGRDDAEVETKLGAAFARRLLERSTGYRVNAV